MVLFTDFELAACRSLVGTARAIASTLGRDKAAIELRVWAQMVEEALERQEGKLM